MSSTASKQDIVDRVASTLTGKFWPGQKVKLTANFESNKANLPKGHIATVVRVHPDFTHMLIIKEALITGDDYVWDMAWWEPA